MPHDKLPPEEIDKLIKEATADVRSAKRGADGAGSRLDDAQVGAALVVQCAADVTPEAVEWLWPGRVALGKLALIGGEPGLGKSQVSIAMVAAVTTGGEWPCGEGDAPQGNVVILSAEDGVADTIVPRLMAAGADRERVHIVSAVKDVTGRRGFNLAADLALLEQAIARFGDVRLVIIDPISSYLGSRVDSHVNAAVRSVLEPVSEMAARLGIAIVAITHQPKSTGTAAIHRFIGSIAFVAAARSAYLVISDPEDKDRRLLLPVKSNLAPLGKGLAFRLEQRVVHDPDREIVASSVVWDPEPVTVTADQALKATDEQRAGTSAGSEAEDFVRDILAGGPVAVRDIHAAAREAGLSWATVRRAKDKLGVVSKHVAQGRGDGGRLDGHGEWLWSLPSTPPQTVLRCSPTTQGAHVQNISAFGKNEHLRSHGPPKVLSSTEDAHPFEASTFGDNEHLRDQEGGQGILADDHAPSQKPNGKGGPDQPRTCAQCRAAGPPLHQLEGSDPPVWLHPECRGFWLKDHPTTNGARLAKYEPDFKVLARRYEERFNSSRKGGCEGDKEGCDAWLRRRLSDVIPPALVEPAFDRVMQQVVFGQEDK